MGMLRLMLPLIWGRRHESEDLINARRRLLTVRGHWYSIMLQLHRFMIAVARVAVHNDGRGGTAPDPLVWDQGGWKKARRTDIRVNIDLATLPGPPGRHPLQIYCFPSNFALAAGFGGYGSFWGFFFGTTYPFRAMGWT